MPEQPVDPRGHKVASLLGERSERFSVTRARPNSPPADVGVPAAFLLGECMADLGVPLERHVDPVEAAAAVGANRRSSEPRLV